MKATLLHNFPSARIVDDNITSTKPGFHIADIRIAFLHLLDIRHPDGGFTWRLGLPLRLVEKYMHYIETLLVVGRHLDAELAHPDDRAGLLALLAATLRLALVAGHDGDPRELVLLLLRLLLRTHYALYSSEIYLNYITFLEEHWRAYRVSN